MTRLQPAQFSIGRVLVVTAFLAAGLAVIAPLIRSWDANRQLLFAFLCAGGLLPPAFAVLLVAIRRRRLERLGGALLLHLWHPFRRFMLWLLLPTSVAIFISCVLLAFEVVLTRDFDPIFALPAYWLLSPGIVYLALTAPHGWELCTHGVVIARVLKFLPWDDIHSYHWEGQRGLLLILQIRNKRKKCPVSPDLKADVQKILEDHGVKPSL
jgi:hypothetical protein